MALKKSIKQHDGITTNYHRILFILSSINSHISISVASYVDEQIREEELNKVIESPYIVNHTYEIEYKENMTIKEAYEYLKTLDEFKDAENV